MYIWDAYSTFPVVYRETARTATIKNYRTCIHKCMYVTNALYIKTYTLIRVYLAVLNSKETRGTYRNINISVQ